MEILCTVVYLIYRHYLVAILLKISGVVIYHIIIYIIVEKIYKQILIYEVENNDIYKKIKTIYFTLS